MNYLINEFVDYLEVVKGYSKNTTESYRHDIEFFFRYLEIKKVNLNLEEIKRKRKNGKFYHDYTLIDISDISLKDLVDISSNDLIAFLGFLTKQRAVGASSRKRKIASLRKFFNYLIQSNQIQSNPTNNLEAPKLEKKEPNFLTLTQAQDLIDAVEGKYAIRDKAILIMFLNLGLRVSELTNIKLDDIQENIIHIKGKGSKSRNLALNDACLQAIDNYLPFREEQLKNLSEKPPYLFISQKGCQFTSRGIQGIVQKYVKKINLDPHKYTVHSLRHTFATLVHNYANEDIRVIQKVLGHESVATTEIYTHLDNFEVYRAINQNPLSQYEVKEDATFNNVKKFIQKK